MISRVRIDDVLVQTSDAKIVGRELQKFQKHINWCIDAGLYVVPNILCQDLAKFPDCIAYLREQKNEGVLDTFDLHGWDHGPYDTRSFKTVLEHLKLGIDWIETNLEVTPFRWVTPHGSISRVMEDAADVVGLVIETTVVPVIDQRAADGELKRTKDLTFLDGRVIMSHWWERGLALYRLSKCLQYGSVQAAINATKGELGEDWFKCWNGWI